MRHDVLRFVTALLSSLAVIGLLAGCGGGGDSSSSDSNSEDLTLAQLQQRLNFQFLIGEAETAQGEAFAKTLKEGSVISCWSEGPTPICAAAVPNGINESGFYHDHMNDWTYFKATFEPGKTRPEVEEVDPEEALNPEEAELSAAIEKEEQERDSPEWVGRCLKHNGLIGVKSESVGAGRIYAELVGGQAPSGAGVGALFTKSPSVGIRMVAVMEAKGYEVRIGDGRKVLALFPKEATREDKQIVERCLIRATGE